ncbi:MAG: RNA polymerase-binding protein DksA [Holosporaceae bacterium]|jgi:DnaK suppressor protein|nr:RNA polymerase-binding protein DksA [Holosporaceae bacterium]
MDNEICELPDGYRPLEKEEFMCDFQLEYFRRKLVRWKEDILCGTDDIIKCLIDDTESCIDVADRASTETDLAYELRTKERARKLINKIDEALLRIKNKTYGFCEMTGEPIALKRLEARPVATLSVEAQERHEKLERAQKDQ